MIKIIIIIISFILFGCKGELQSSAEKAIEAKQNEIWITRVQEASDYAVTWKSNAERNAIEMPEILVINLEKSIEEYRKWKDIVEIEGKISPTPIQFLNLINDTEQYFSRSIAKVHDARGRIDREKAELLQREAQILKESQAAYEREGVLRQEAEAKVTAEREAANSRQEVERKLESAKRKELLDLSFEMSKSEQFAFEQSFAQFRSGNAVVLLPDPSGQTIVRLTSVSEKMIEAVIRAQNNGIRSAEYADVTQIFFTFSVQELLPGKECNQTYERSYLFKKVIPINLKRTEIKEINVMLPKFFDRGCWTVTAVG
jgi:hypothetical protein